MAESLLARSGGVPRGVVAEATRRAYHPPAIRSFGDLTERPSAELHLQGFGVRVHVADYTAAGAIDVVRARVPRTLIGDAEGVADVRYDVRDGSIRRDGRTAFEGPMAPALHWLVSDIDAGFAMRATEGLFVHAGVVVRHGRAILIPGKSGVGKSTLVAALVAAGATYYSDEYAPVDADGFVHPYARTPSPRHAAAPVVTVTDEPRPPVRPAVVLATTFAAGARWAPDTLVGARALLPVVDNTVLTRNYPAAALAMARRLAPHVVTLSGPRPDAATVASEILASADAIIQG